MNEISCTGHNNRDTVECANAAEKLFPVGRIFASHQQIDQILVRFSDRWGFRKTHPGCYLACHYGKSIHNTRRLNDYNTCGVQVKRRNTHILKYNCSFKINYRLIKSYGVTHDGVKVPKIYFQAQITKANYLHTCELNTQSHRQAIISSGGLTFDLDGVIVPISLLKTNPRLSTKILRPYLEKYIPFYKSCDASFIRNFRKRVAAYNIVHGHDNIPTYNDVEKLISSKEIAANEIMIEDCTMSHDNLSELLKKIMQEGDGHWLTIKFFENQIEAGRNIKYHVRYDEKTFKPVAVCWMLLEMHEDLIRYGDTLFLDAQKKDINTPGWVYIGPVINTNEKEVRVTCECLSIVEDIPTYQWVIEMMEIMEPRFSRHNIRFIFCDQLITSTLLNNLGITRTCRLHGDFWHLINIVFPNTFFGYYTQLKPILQKMLKCETEKEWINCYNHALEKVLNNAEIMCELENIFKNPEYYSKWQNNLLFENLDNISSASAEQNHSSICAIFIICGNLSIVEHIIALINRYAKKHAKRIEEAYKRKMLRKNYESTSFTGCFKLIDEEAHTYLATYMYNLFKKELYFNMIYNYEESNVGVWYYHVYQPSYSIENRTECPYYQKNTCWR